MIIMINYENIQKGYKKESKVLKIQLIVFNFQCVHEFSVQ